MYKRINVKKQNTSIKVIKTICCLVFFGSIANGNEMPSGPKIKSGNVVINGEGTSHLKINQMTDKSIINWNSFSIHKKGKVDFQMPSSSSTSLNRVTGSTPSTIAGSLNSNGNVFLINPNGVVISQSGVVRTGSFVTSSLDIKNEDFIDGNFKFNATPNSRGVSNSGKIHVNSGGNTALIGKYVENNGVVKAKLGKIAITKFTLINSFRVNNEIELSYVKCRLLTGRTHQIRVHMSHIGNPLIGDRKYSRNNYYLKLPERLKKFVLENFIKLERHALHARFLGFYHPVMKKQLEFESKLPLDFLELFDNLSHYSKKTWI